MEPDEDQHYFVRLTFLLRWNLGFRGKLVLLITPTLDINPWTWLAGWFDVPGQILYLYGLLTYLNEDLFCSLYSTRIVINLSLPYDPL